MSNIAKNSLPSTALLALISIANPFAAIALPSTENSQAVPSPAPNYGCISGNPDGTYQGDRAVTRYEFAAALNSCLNQIDRQLETPPTPSNNQATREDFLELTNQMERDLQELRNLNQRLENIESELK